MSHRPLTGVRIVDLTQVMSGPFATMILADLGAEVVKVEPPTGDPTRSFPPLEIDGDSTYFHSLNRSKLSVTLDLSSEDDRHALAALVATADVVVDNFRPSVRRRLRCTHEDLVAIRGDVITCSISGYGQESARADDPSYDLAIQAYAGAMRLTGEPDGPPLRLGIPVGDLAGSLYAVIGILAALAHRTRTGEGQHVDVSLLRATASLHTYQLVNHLATGTVPEPLGSGHTALVPFRAYRTSDGHVCVMAPSDKFWAALCGAIGRPELVDDPRCASAAARLQNRSFVDGVFAEVLAGRSTADWVRVIRAAGVPVAPVNDLGQAVAEPEIRAMLGTIERGGSQVPLIHNPIELSATPLDSYVAAPRLGQNDDLLVRASACVAASEMRVVGVRRTG